MNCAATAPSGGPSAYLPPGTVLARRYRIDARLAEGGMGIVYQGCHLQLGQRIAIKVVRPEHAHRPEDVDRFLNEARLMARLRGIHTVRVLDTGDIDGHWPYIVLEYLHGSDLRAVLRAEGRLPISEAVDCLLQVCEGLAEAHALGIVHRDIKPENLFLSRSPDGDEVVKIIDFGIAERMPADRSDAPHGDCYGSPQYMAPEQITSPDRIDVRADIWSLGVVAYELLTGTVPFGTVSASGVRCRALCAEPTPLRDLRGDLPAELERIVLRCLRKGADERFADVQELAEALAPFGPEPCVVSVGRVRRLLAKVDRARSEPVCLAADGMDEADGDPGVSPSPRTCDLGRTTQISPGPPPSWRFLPQAQPRLRSRDRTRSSVSMLGGLATCSSKPAATALRTSSGCA